MIKRRKVLCIQIHDRTGVGGSSGPVQEFWEQLNVILNTFRLSPSEQSKMYIKPEKVGAFNRDVDTDFESELEGKGD